MVSLKDRRQSGRYTPKATCNPKELKAAGIEIPTEYDDWSDHRDSMRDWYKDFKLIKKVTTTHYATANQELRIRMNKKQELLQKRRQAKKWREENVHNIPYTEREYATGFI